MCAGPFNTQHNTNNTTQHTHHNTISLPGQAGCGMLLLARRLTVAILAQGTSWAVAVTQAFLRCWFKSWHACKYTPKFFWHCSTIVCSSSLQVKVRFWLISIYVRNMHVHPVAKFAGRGLPSPSGLLRGPPRTMITKVAGLADLLGGFRGLVIECTRGCFNIQAFHVVSIPQHNTFPHQVLGIDVW